MAGMTSHEVTVGVCQTSTGKTVYLKTGTPKDHYLTNVSWTPDEKYVLIALLNRETNAMDFNMYDISTGDLVRTVFTEKDEHWVEPSHTAYFLPDMPKEFIWQSERDGHNHLYLYSLDKGLIAQLTRGDWDVLDLAGWSAVDQKLHFTANPGSALEKHFCTVDLNGQFSQLTQSNGQHNLLFNKYNACYIDIYSNRNTPRITSVNDKAGKEIHVLLKSDNPLKNYTLGSMKLFTLPDEFRNYADEDQALRKDPLYCRMILPPGFDSTKQYPSITYVYNGPHVQLVTDSWLGGADMWLWYLAQEGYVVFTIDGHGSGNRGYGFEKPIHRRLGTVELADQSSGNAFLRSLSFIDTARMGIDGWSFGGFMTVGLMTRTPGLYKVGVAGGPVMDWSYYEVMYTERYMDTPQENPEGYKTSCLYNYIDKLQGKMMLIHGTSDNVVVWQHSLKYLKLAVQKGKQLDYFVYPGHEHNVLGKDRVHLMEKITRYFKDNL
jgi:dipeptidyl-peptidase-4